MSKEKTLEKFEQGHDMTFNMFLKFSGCCVDKLGDWLRGYYSPGEG